MTEIFKLNRNIVGFLIRIFDQLFRGLVNLIFLSHQFKILLVWFCLTSTVQGMSHRIDRSFKLIFWGVELGQFEVKADIDGNKYNVSTHASGKSLIRLFSQYEISSGAVGIIDINNNLIPIHSMTKWNTRGKFEKTQLNYQDGRLAKFEVSPKLIKNYHIENPIGIESTIDPVSLVVWLLLEREYDQLCENNLKILDGFRMSELSFENKKIFPDSLICLGEIKRLQGFKNSDFNNKPFQFKIFYSLNHLNVFEVSKIEVETILGKIILE